MMYVLLALLIVLCVALIFVVVFLIRRNLDLTDRIDLVDDQVEDCLNVLNDVHGRFAKYANHPVFLDEPVIKQFMSDIRYAKHAFHKIAYKLENANVEDLDESRAGEEDE